MDFNQADEFRFQNPPSSYFKVLEKRKKESRAYKKYQDIGLEVSKILADEKHKSLYIKLVKERGERIILSIAKEVAERKNVKNKGAYFMKVLTGFKKSK